MTKKMIININSIKFIKLLKYKINHFLNINKVVSVIHD